MIELISEEKYEDKWIELISEEKYEDKWFEAEFLMPLQVGVRDDGVVVMRTASTNKLEIMDLSKPGQDSCWTETFSFSFKVRALRPGESYTLKLS